MEKSKCYVNGSQKCNLCVAGKFNVLLSSSDFNTLHKSRSETFSRCKHIIRFLLSNLSALSTADELLSHRLWHVFCYFVLYQLYLISFPPSTRTRILVFLIMFLLLPFFAPTFFTSFPDFTLFQNIYIQRISGAWNTALRYVAHFYKFYKYDCSNFINAWSH